jgi:hypothetical protein
MLEIGTSLLSQTAEQTRKLTDVETQVCSWGRVYTHNQKISFLLILWLLP